jgi:hypothetical protein
MAKILCVLDKLYNHVGSPLSGRDELHSAIMLDKILK